MTAAAADAGFGGAVVWTPDTGTVRGSRLWQFAESHGLSDPAALHARSVADPAWYWDAVLADLRLRWRVPYRTVMDLSAGVPWARWCVGGRMNIADGCVHRHAAGEAGGRTALVWEGEAGEVRSFSFAELSREVRRAAAGLRSVGLGKGDVVGLLLPMVPETAVALLALAHIGAVALPLFSGYGEAAVASRLEDARAVALITADAAVRRGKLVPLKAVADAAAASVPGLRTIIVVGRHGPAVPMREGRDHWWAGLVERCCGPDGEPLTGAEIEDTDAEDVLLLLHTSGTTGKPKAAVHTHCGFPIKAAADMAHGMDVRAGDMVHWVTDLGWMMGPWLIYGAGLLGAGVLLTEGAPDFPGPDRLWATAGRHGVTLLGVSPTLVRALSAHGEAPARRHEMPALRAFGSTGEPWTPEAWTWLFDVVGRRRLPVLNYSGGTEISGGILCGNMVSPLKPCTFAGPLPGMDADVVDETGRPVRGTGGELVLRQPWIGMTRGFLRDPERYLRTYWQTIPGLWVHGDRAVIDSDGQWTIPGRSDDTLKVAGKRVGPAEIEGAIAGHAAVLESAAVGLPDPLKGQVPGCFVVLRPGVVTDDGNRETLREELRDAVAAQLGKALRPAEVRFVTDLPKTRNGKILRRLVRAAWLGEPTGDTGSLADPGSLQRVRESV